VIFQVHPPRLGWRLGTPTMHQVENCSLGDLNSQLEQLAMNSGHTLKRVDVRHLKNKVADLKADRRPPGSFLLGLKSLERLETLSMPQNDSFEFDSDQWSLPVAPETTKHNPEKAVFCSSLRPFLMTFPDGQFLEDY